MAVSVAFAIAGLILIIGFIGNYLFRRIEIPDILILVFLGYLIGPFFKIVDANTLTPLLPVFVSLALLIILFDGGLNLNLNKVISESPRAIVLAVSTFLLSTLAVAFFAHFAFGWALIKGALLGAIIGGTSSATVIPLVNRAFVSEKIKTLLSLETAFNDALVVVGALTLLSLLTQTAGAGLYMQAARNIASAFSTGAVAGLIAGLFWLKILHHIRGEIYDDVITLAFVLLMFAVVEGLGGSGAFFALMFGLVLGNGYVIAKVLHMKKIAIAGVLMKKFQSQISFLLRTFFFVYIGLMFSISNILILVYAGIICAILLFARLAATYISSFDTSFSTKERNFIVTMFPKGLASAVLVQMVIAYSVPGANVISEIVVTIIIMTTIIAAVYTSLFQYRVRNTSRKEIKLP